MVRLARVILEPNYDSDNSLGDLTIEPLPTTSIDYEPMETAWKTALAIANSQACKRALAKLAKLLNPDEDPEILVENFIAELNHDRIESRYLLLVDGRLEIHVLGKYQRPLSAVHLNRQYVRSIGATMGDEESRLRCLLATAIVHEFAHCFGTFMGLTERDVTPENINHRSYVLESPGMENLEDSLNGSYGVARSSGKSRMLESL
ncbi:hypothetical protein ABW21_db0204213 [Orbilia brochopaga]|nr:hypothetical protein ABW21_db0204213 [Drechslerella brochopaga]